MNFALQVGRQRR